VTTPGGPDRALTSDVADTLVVVESRRRPVIADVAREAGVSVPTVSRVLSGSVPVSDEKRAQVLDAMKRLNWRPHPAARALAKGDRQMIGVIALNTVRYGYARTLQGIEEAAREAGYLVLIAVVESAEPAAMDAAIDLMLGQTVAGVAVIEFDPVGVAVSRALPPGIPVVAAAAAGQTRSPHPHAYLDDRVAAREATEYLLGLGHRTVHHLAGPADSAPAEIRVDTWREHLVGSAREVPAVVRGDWSARSGYEQGRLLAADPDVTAVFCANDEMAAGLVRALYEHGRRVPDDLSVVGFDDIPLTEFLWPPLTTVQQDFHLIGRQLMDLLLRQIRHGAELTDHRIVVPTRLMVRESTAPPRA
jgi:DNA-binding LacI/PurR family transcriptional regulator